MPAVSDRALMRFPKAPWKAEESATYITAMITMPANAYSAAQQHGSGSYNTPAGPQQLTRIINAIMDTDAVVGIRSAMASAM